MSNAWACLYVSTTQWHSCTPPPLPSLSDSLLVWPTEGNSYSLVIMGRMICALECALPAWLPLRRPAGAKNGRPPRGAKDGVRTERWCESGVWPGRWITLVIISERFDQISSIVPCKWVSGEESVLQWSWAGVMLEGREGQRGGRDRWRGVDTVIWDR